jgi:hypothetical protein
MVSVARGYEFGSLLFRPIRIEDAIACCHITKNSPHGSLFVIIGLFLPPLPDTQRTHALK